MPFIAAIPNAGWAAAAKLSSPIAFGSKRVPAGFAVWIVGTPLRGDLLDAAARVFLYDAIVDNPDRRDPNPNCLLRGRELRLIDHEMCFSPLPLVGWSPPWRLGSLQHLERPGAHIFRSGLRGQLIDWAPIKAAWKTLSDARLVDCAAMLPAAWSGAEAAVDAAIRKIRGARDNIDGCIAEVQRVLT